MNVDQYWLVFSLLEMVPSHKWPAVFERLGAQLARGNERQKG